MPSISDEKNKTFLVMG